MGAAPGTDVYSPVDGTLVGITPYVLNGHQYGVRIDISPTSAPSVVVSVTNLRPDPALVVGSTVVASGSRLGTVLDVSRVERQALARYTQDSGNHVAVQVKPAATLAVVDLASLAGEGSSGPSPLPPTPDAAQEPEMRILFLADVFGAPGRRALEVRLPALREELGVEFCIVNGENAAGGAGLTAATARSSSPPEPTSSRPGTTSGTSARSWPARARPAHPSPGQLPDGIPGRGRTVVSGSGAGSPSSTSWGASSCRSSTTRSARPTGSSRGCAARRRRSSSISTPRRRARRWRSRGTSTAGRRRCSERIPTSRPPTRASSPAARPFITDVGMTGPFDSVIGVRAELAIQRMRTGMPVRFHPAEGGVRIEGVLIGCGPDGRATSCEAVRIDA